MECKITSIKPRRCAAMTLVEMMFSTAIGLLVLAAVGSLTTYTARSLAAMSNYVTMDGKSRNAIDVLTSQIRKMDSLTSISSNSISFKRGGANVSFVYSPTNATLWQVTDSATTALLPNCTSVTFSIFQRNTISNTFDQFPTSVSSNTCKVVQINLASSMKLLGSLTDTELQQSAKVVMRRE